MWYLSEELVCFSLFDDKVPISTKSAIVKSLTDEKDDVVQERRIKAELQVEKLQEIDLMDFATYRSNNFLKILNLDNSFLQVEIESWPRNESFKKCKQICLHLKVVNDIAERGVALIQEYNVLHTKNEKEKQDILLGVAQNRKDLPNFDKNQIMSFINKS